MELYLIRHAEAAPLGEGGVNEDEDRPLTEAGREQSRLLADGLKRLGIGLDLVLTSPLIRARHTAEGMLEKWGQPTPELHVAEELAPGGRRGKLARRLRRQGRGRIALIGHAPSINRFAAWLMGSKKSKLELTKAGVAYIHCEDGAGKGEGVLLWLATPDWMQRSLPSA